jgi:hypothetical protein
MEVKHVYMKQLSQITIQRVSGTATIDLLLGDLSALPLAHATDILVISAFPGDYTPLAGSLIGALHQQGLSIAALAQDKETDLRGQLHCWLSKPLPKAAQQKFNVKRILCFEPGERIADPQEAVNNIFRCINTFVFDEDNNEVAMPIVASGSQRVPLQQMLPALLQAAVFWLQNGLPLTSIKLAVYHQDQEEQAVNIFNAIKNNLQAPPQQEKIPAAPSFSEVPSPPASAVTPRPVEPGIQPAPVKKGYDYFLSYAHKHAREVQYFVDELTRSNNSLAVFYDKDSIPPGGMWIQQISAAIQQADKVLVFLSPDYDNSPVCWDEFQCAKLMEYNRKKSIIQTVYLYGHQQTEMPLIMGIYSYIDCREGNTEKIQRCVQQLIK